VRDVSALQGAINTIRDRLGPIEILVNNAARDDRHEVEAVTAAYWDERIAVNLRHQFFAAQAVYPQMKSQGGGSIINFGSISWMIGQGGMPAYTTSKAAVHGLTRGLARDFGAAGVRVNTVSPGWVMTQRQIDLWLNEDGEREIARRQCLKRKLMAADVARMVLFLAADDSAMCTSQNFIVDGGWV
jgi:NAD(P)-dependent dehydrogenase (short-subunit alcohol dehydrogenase family)